MTDDLKERLRHADEYEPLGHDGWEALDCITDLEARLAAAETEIIRLEQEALRLREELLEQRGAKAEAAAMMREAEAERDAALAQVAMTVFCADCENTTTRTDDDRCSVCGSGRIMVGKAPSAALSRRDAQMRAEGRKDGRWMLSARMPIGPKMNTAARSIPRCSLASPTPSSRLRRRKRFDDSWG